MAVLYIAAVAAPQSSTRRNWNISVIWFVACVHGFHKDRWIPVAQPTKKERSWRRWLHTMRASKPASVGEQPHSCLVYVMLPKNRQVHLYSAPLNRSFK